MPDSTTKTASMDAIPRTLLGLVVEVAHKVWVNVGILGGTLVITVFFFLFSPALYIALRSAGLDSARTARRVTWLYGRVWAVNTSLFVPFDWRENTVRVDGPCIVVANHNSFFDVYCLGAQPVDNIVMVVRGWPFKLPLYKYVMRQARYINSEAGGSEDLVAKVKKAIARGASILVFPEGTRSRNGKMGRFKSGAFLLSVATGAPVVPYCISGTGKLLAPGKRFLTPARLAVRTLDPVYPDKYQGRRDAHMALRKEVKIRMAEALAGMEASVKQGAGG